MVEKLTPQDNVYTLITSNPTEDEFEVISSITSVYPGSDVANLRRLFADPKVSIVTSTVIEKGYMRDSHGDLDISDEAVQTDIAALKSGDFDISLRTIPFRMVTGFLARRAADAGPITVLPCDNLAGNGPAFRRVVEQAIDLIDSTLLEWTHDNVSWATSMVDRITPATTENDTEAVRQATGLDDAWPVRTEPFCEWVIAGDFPSGRPAWEEAGVTFTEDVTPYENRKLWMLNGAHSTLAYCGSVLGYSTVSETVANETLVSWINEWWDLASLYIDVPTDDYRAQLLERFANPRIRHQLMQIASDGSQKLPVRIVPVALKAIADHRALSAPARTVAAWILFLRRYGADAAADPDLENIVNIASLPDQVAVQQIVAYLSKDLSQSQKFITEVSRQLHTIEEYMR